jgi:3-hydroxyisobutyrate dehydrogenase-like beta-hydroxyacid dehydrogenase
VTADQAAIAAGGCAPHLKPGALWLDLNSCAPSTKKSAAETVEAAGARYVDVAVMAPVYPKRNMVPLLLAGPHAETVKPLLEALPMSPRVVDGPVGSASSIKMIRSIMMKGMEALTAECVLAAVRAGVDDEVLSSLQASNPDFDWRARSAYNFERSLAHGIRRAAEMREVVKTVADLGFSPDMASATVEWQARMGALGLGPEVNEDDNYRDIAGKVLNRLDTTD